MDSYGEETCPRLTKYFHLICYFFICYIYALFKLRHDNRHRSHYMARAVTQQEPISHIFSFQQKSVESMNDAGII